jgi:hypothetical protein
MPILACVFVAMTVPPANAAALPSIFVDPQNGSDADGCGGVAPCKTVAHAVRKLNGGGTSISLAAGVYLEPSVNISSFASLIISGVPSATIFDCSRRLHTPGAVFYIRNSTLTITGVTFMNCVNSNSNGGALAAVGSSVAVLQCSFMNCSAASGGAMHITGSDNRVFVNVQNSSFLGNSAVGGFNGCADAPASPCSAWGGAIASYDVFNVTISGCLMVENNVRASVPAASLQHSATRNAVAGGGCVSVLFSGNTSGTSVRVTGNSFELCTVHVSSSDNVNVGNGVFVRNPYCVSCLMLLQDTVERYRSTSVSLSAASCSMFLFAIFCCRRMCSRAAL